MCVAISSADAAQLIVVDLPSNKARIDSKPFVCLTFEVDLHIRHRCHIRSDIDLDIWIFVPKLRNVEGIINMRALGEAVLIDRGLVVLQVDRSNLRNEDGPSLQPPLRLGYCIPSSHLVTDRGCRGFLNARGTMSMLDFLERSTFNQIIVRLTRSRTQLCTRINLKWVFLNNLTKLDLFFIKN